MHRGNKGGDVPERNFKGISASVMVRGFLKFLFLEIIFYIKQAPFTLLFLSEREREHKNLNLGTDRILHLKQLQSEI